MGQNGIDKCVLFLEQGIFSNLKMKYQFCWSCIFDLYCGIVMFYELKEVIGGYLLFWDVLDIDCIYILWLCN